MSVTITITVSCKKHPKYQGARERIGTCWGCADVWFLRHPDNLIPDCQIEKVEVHSA